MAKSLAAIQLWVDGHARDILEARKELKALSPYARDELNVLLSNLHQTQANVRNDHDGDRHHVCKPIGNLSFCRAVRSQYHQKIQQHVTSVPHSPLRV